jgi:hypothetical protein
MASFSEDGKTALLEKGSYDRKSLDVVEEGQFPSFLPSYLHSFLPSFLPSFFPSFLPSLPPSQKKSQRPVSLPP